MEESRGYHHAVLMEATPPSRAPSPFELLHTWPDLKHGSQITSLAVAIVPSADGSSESCQILASSCNPPNTLQTLDAAPEWTVRRLESESGCWRVASYQVGEIRRERYIYTHISCTSALWLTSRSVS
jgi:hypothetical protein